MIENNIFKYMDNLTENLFDFAETYGDVELGDVKFGNNTIEVEIKTLTSVSDPEVNYYEDGWDSIEDFAKLVSEKYLVKTELKEDFLMTGNEYEDWVVRDGWLKLTI